MRRIAGRRVTLWAALGIAAVIALAAVAVYAVGGGFEPRVRVESGTRIVCTQGEVVSDSVRSIEVPASQVARYRVSTRTITCDKHARAALLYGEAQALIASGNFEGASLKLQEVLALFPRYRSAVTQLDAMKAGRRPSAETTSGAGKTGGGAGGPSIPSAPTLAKFAPDVLDGYKAQPVQTDPMVITRRYEPVSRPGVRSLVIVAEQFKNAAGAGNALRTNIKSHYTEGVSSVPVGAKSAYFGTDGHRYAIVAVNFGGILLAIEAGCKGGSPSALKSELASVLAAVTR